MGSEIIFVVGDSDEPIMDNKRSQVRIRVSVVVMVSVSTLLG